MMIRQREVDLPLVPDKECEERLKPLFLQRGVTDWRLRASEICAGGIPGRFRTLSLLYACEQKPCFFAIGKDSCQGEGGAPLVCYDEVRINFHQN